MHAQQVESGQQTAEDGAGDIAAVEEAEPGHALAACVSSQRAMAGSVAPISMVGGSRHRPAIRPRITMPTIPDTATAVYKAVEDRHAEQHQQSDGADAQLEEGVDPHRMVARGDAPAAAARLPRHIPPMNVPSSTPRETAEDPMTSSRSWNQTIS